MFKLKICFDAIKTRQKTLSKIEFFEKELVNVTAEKNRHMSKPAEYAKFWVIENDYRRNIALLKELL